MARLPTIAPPNAVTSASFSSSVDSLEVVIDNNNNSSELETTEMTVTPRPQRTNAAARKKLNGIWRKLAALSSADLVHELKAIHDYLAPMDQDLVDRTELLDLSAQLAAQSLIKHKDRAVRILTACALANILRLFAPEAPYSADQLEGMFVLFLHQLKGVADAQDPYYNYHYFLLESLSTVKSVVLIFDLPQAELIQREFIQMALELMHPSVIKGVRLYLLELVQTLLEEADQQLPLELVTETLLPALDSSNSAQSTMISDLLKLCADKLQTPLGIHFNDQLSRLARNEESETVLAKVGKEAHDFAVKIASISPVAAAAILKLLEQELTVEAVEVRLLAINAITRILIATSSNNSNGGVGKSPYLQPLRAAWMSRRNDKNFKCRNAWVRGAIEVFNAGAVGNDEIANALLEGLQERLVDFDDRVRLALLNEFLAAGVSECLNAMVKLSAFPEFLSGVTDRCLDKKEDVQDAAKALTADILFCILRSTPQSPLLDTLINQLLQLPYTESRIFSRAAIGFLEEGIFTRMAREFPKIEERCERLVALLRSVYTFPANVKSLNTLRALFRQKSNFCKAWLGLLKIARLQQANSSNDLMAAKAVQLAQYLAELVPGVPELEAQRALISIPSLLPAETLQLLIDLAEGRTSFAKIDAHFKASSVSINPQMKRTIAACLPIGSQVSINTVLIDGLSAASHDSVASTLLQDILSAFPHLFANRTAELVESVLKEPTAAHMKALSQYVLKDQSSSSSNRKKLATDPQAGELERRMLEIVHPPIGSKSSGCLKSVASAAQILLQLTNTSELIENLVLQLANIDDPDQVQVALAALTGLVKAGQARGLLPHFETVFSLICNRCFPADFNNTSILPASTTKKSKSSWNSSSSSDLLANWPLIADLPHALKMAVLSVRFLAVFASMLIRQYTRGQVPDESGSGGDLELVSSLRSITLGFFMERLQTISSIGGKYKQIVRLKYSLLKGLITCLPDASISDLTDPLLPLFLSVQDGDHSLRLKLVTLLGRLLTAHRLSPAFLSLLFFAGAHEPLPEVRGTVKSFITQIGRSARGLIERELLPVLCVVVVKHPDCHQVRDNQQYIRGYFDFFNECSLNAANCADIYESISALKLFHFPTDSAASVRLYQVSELAQLSIKDRCMQHHWPLSSGSQQQDRQALSMLVPDVLVQLGEAEQIRNIHRVYLQEEAAAAAAVEHSENVIDNAKYNANVTAVVKGSRNSGAVSRTRVKLGSRQRK